MCLVLYESACVPKQAWLRTQRPSPVFGVSTWCRGTATSLYMAAALVSDRHRASYVPAPSQDVELAARSPQRFQGISEHGASDRDSSVGLLEEAQGPLEERLEEQAFAKKYIAHSRNGRDLLKRAEEVVKEDWLANVRSLPGNIYRCTAFGKHIGVHLGENSSNGWKAVVRLFGFLTVWVIQVCGPPAICLSMVFTWGVMDEDRIRWEKWAEVGFFYTDDWKKIACTKSLACALVFVFCLNGLYTVLDDMDGWHKVDDIFRYLQRITPSCNLPGEKYLFLGAITNCWVVLWCCIDAYLVIGSAKTPKDAIMDSLGLLFLFHLDDISGEVAFVSEDSWPGECLGWVYDNMVRDVFTPDDINLAEEKRAPLANRMIHILHWVTALLLGMMSIVLPILSCITPFRIMFRDSAWGN